MKRTRRQLDLQAKIILVLIAIILPTFLIVTFAQNQFMQPILKDEILQIGISSAKELATDIASSRLLTQPNASALVENRIQDEIYTQPSIVRVDVFRKNAAGQAELVASNFEEDPSSPTQTAPLPEITTSEFRIDEAGIHLWDIAVPIHQHKSRESGPKHTLGWVHLQISSMLVEKIGGTLWKATASAAAFSVVTLVLALSFFLKKTIENDRKLREAETQNLQLTEQLHDTQRQLMNTEKLAVMGQLTASFAHELGTPLNAIGGHLQLLGSELKTAAINPAVDERLGIIHGQLAKIEEIVKGFLQSTAKPVSQKQLVDLNLISDKALRILKPVIDSVKVEIHRDFDRSLGPVRAVPLEIEQILMNLISNALDSLRTRTAQRSSNRKLLLEVSTAAKQMDGKQWAEVSVYDTGIGIKKPDLKNVLKPFFTTKPPGEGTGLGLTICQQLAHKHGGMLEIDSKEEAWTRVTLRLPFEAKNFASSS